MRHPACSSGTLPGQAGTRGHRLTSEMPKNAENAPFFRRDKHWDRPGQRPETPSKSSPFAPLEGARGGTAGQTLGGFCPSRLKTAEIRHFHRVVRMACPGLCPGAALQEENTK